MGSSVTKMEPFNIQVPDIPRLSDSNNYWYWRILLRAYLDALGLWSGNAPIECAQSKFILLSTVELWLISRDYETKSAIAIFNDLHLRFGTGRIHEI